MWSGRTQAAPTSVRINAGAATAYTDNNGNAWLADQLVTGGTTYANSNTIASGTPAPQVYRSERYGQGKTSFAYSIPVSNGNYNVNLDFAESYVTGSGQRIFNVSINGTQVLTNFDIYAAAGGMNIPVVKTFNVAVTNGTLNINFLPGSVENPKVSGIEVVPISVSSSVRINAGAATSYTDNNGNAWLADQLVTGGTAYTNSNTITGSTPAPQVYHSERYGQGKTSFAYNIPVSNGNYNVNLDFAESYVTGSGQRIFNVSINGTQVLTNFDIYATAGGMNIPVMKTFNVAVTNGTLNVNFLPGSVENPKVNGIEVVQSTLPPPTSTLGVTAKSMTTGTLSLAYSSTLSATGGSIPYTWSLLSGALPNGLALSSSGVISGTPTVAGSFPFTVAVKDSSSASASANLSINVVAAAPPTVSISSPANGATVSGTVAVSGVASSGVAISSVQVSVDGGAFANASGTSNWSFSLNTNSLSNSAHSLSAKVIDSAGKSATSSLVDFTVNNSSTAADCTLFASPSGNDSNSGASPSAPKSFFGAANATQPGSVLCLLGGTYNLSSSFTPPNSGSPSAWIVYKNYGDGPVNFVYTGSANAASI
jgi:hypothetical protein